MGNPRTFSAVLLRGGSATSTGIKFRLNHGALASSSSTSAKGRQLQIFF